MIKQRTVGEMIFDKLNMVFLIAFSITIIFPFWQQLIISISSPEEAMRKSLHLFTSQITLKPYIRIFSSGQIAKAYYWTIVRCVLGTGLTLVVSSMFAYPLSKKYLPLRDFWTGLLVFTMFFGGGLVPTYLLVRNLHLIDTIWALILPGVLGAFNVILMRNFFMALPDSLEESAQIDGAGEMRILLQIIMPLSMPILATIGLWSIVGHWNAWFDAIIYINGTKITVIQLVLRKVLLENQMGFSGVFSEMMAMQNKQAREFTPESVKAAILMITTIPILCVYPFLQNYFIKGIMIGSLKG
jgi:putative aldouronate transport system permease protein